MSPSFDLASEPAPGLFPEPVPPSSAWQGTARLRFEASQGKTRLHCYTQAPLKLQRPLYPEGEAVCHSVLVHTAGGMVSSDRLTLDVSLAPGSCALITTAAANKLYRSDGPTAHQQTQIALATDTCLEWFPQESIVFNGARFEQQTQIQLAPGAIWAGWEITRFGRSASGETFDTGHWRSRLEVWQLAHPLWLDRQSLIGGSTTLMSPHGLAGQPVVASFAVLGQTYSAEVLAALRALPQPEPPSQVGLTRLQQGLLCRYCGPSSQAARQWFIQLWHYLRPLYLQRPACCSRIWPQ